MTVEMTVWNPDDGGVNSQPTRLTIPAQGMIASSDLLTALGLGGTYGPMEIRSLENQPLLAVSRVYSPNSTACYFEGVPLEP
jgi:hypothetical protein